MTSAKNGFSRRDISARVGDTETGSDGTTYGDFRFPHIRVLDHQYGVGASGDDTTRGNRYGGARRHRAFWHDGRRNDFVEQLEPCRMELVRTIGIHRAHRETVVIGAIK